MSLSYEKLLSGNDTGETGAHQVGILVPKGDDELLTFFPPLNSGIKNPDSTITCIDPDGEEWQFRYIYYNGKILTPPASTRNEYRITKMTKFLKKWGASAGDYLVFTKTNKFGHYKIRLDQRMSAAQPTTVTLRGWSRVC